MKTPMEGENARPSVREFQPFFHATTMGRLEDPIGPSSVLNKDV